MSSIITRCFHAENPLVLKGKAENLLITQEKEEKTKVRLNAKDLELKFETIFPHQREHYSKRNTSKAK